eukprot:TRINITY_DN2653_c0_g1_i1.p1 TRINITY_DN2653_c0_g1~~TRINITY_DN2653_c0_g1_i1.p1  ORF type:complete len:481 (-),score=114.66 TRINITY_DN2653_c0_g1_i1:82-1524(-)
MKDTAESNLGAKISTAVVSVPVYFDEEQRRATQEAASMVGLDVTLINEPIAAAMAYGMNVKGQVRTVGVFDLGGATFDFTVLNVTGDDFEVKATGGDSTLGGYLLDQALYDYLMSDFKKKEGIDLVNDLRASQRVRDTAERVKCELSTSLTSDVKLPYLAADANGVPKHMDYLITRALLEKLTSDILSKTIPICKKVLDEAGVDVQDLDDIILVGAQTKMPKIHDLVKEFFGKPHAKNVSPDEAIALGAANFGTLFKGSTKKHSVVEVDVTPLNIGVEVQGGVVLPLIPENTPLPTKVSHIFTTAADCQSEVEIKVVLGNNSNVLDNSVIGSVVLKDIPPALRGEPQIELTISVSAGGIVELTAQNLHTNISEKAEIKGFGFTKDELKSMAEKSISSKTNDTYKLKILENNIKGYNEIFELERIINSLAYNYKVDTEAIVKKIDSLRKVVESGGPKDLSGQIKELKLEIAQFVGDNISDL